MVVTLEIVPLTKKVNGTMQQRIKDNQVQPQNHYSTMVQEWNTITGQHILYLKMHHILTLMEERLTTGMVNSLEL